MRNRKNCIIIGLLCLCVAGACRWEAMEYRRRGGPAHGASDWITRIGPDGDKYAVGFAIAGGVGLAGGLLPNRKEAVEKAAEVLLWWTGRDPFTLQQFVSGAGVAVFGRSGSGKSSGSGFHLAKGLVACRNTGGCILASKPDDRPFWERNFADAGRSRDLFIFGQGEPLKFNLIDFEMRHGADTRELTQCILTVGEVLRRGKSGGASQEQFWEQQKERCLYNAIEVVKQGLGKIEIPLLQRFITDAATSPEQLKDETWRKGFHNQALMRAYYTHKTAVGEYDFQQALDFWTKEWSCMDAKLRGSVVAEVLGVLHVFNTGMVRELLSTTTNISPAAMEEGIWVLVNTPVPQYGAGGAFCLAAWKYAVQRHILRRFVLHEAAPIVIWSDEYQNVCNSFDATFLAECRSHRGAMIALTQSIHSFHGAMGDHAGKHQSQALLTNFGLKIFHALGDAESAAYASSLVGKSLQTFTGGSMPPVTSVWDSLTGASGVSGSFNQHFEQVIQDCEFMNGLRTGGPANGYMVDAYVIRSGEPFSNGENFLRCSFDQRG